MVVLGSNGSKTQNANVTSFLVTKSILVDAGNIINALGESFLEVKHLFITHTHFDHIVDLPLVIDTYYAKMRTPLKIYATKESIEHLRENVFNHRIWPDFSNINLLNSKEKTIEFVAIDYGETIFVEKIKFRAFANNHMRGSLGLIINDELMLTSDTYICDEIWRLLNEIPSIDKCITEISFKSDHAELAQLSKHYTPQILRQEMQKLQRKNVKFYLHHLKQSDKREILQELKDFDASYQLLCDGFYIPLSLESDAKAIPKNDLQSIIDKQTLHIRKLNEIGVALSYERDLNRLLEMILQQAKNFTDADAGTLYMMSEDEKSLEFKVVMTDSLGIKMGGTASEISWPPLSLYDENGDANRQMVAAVAAIDGDIINIADVYECEAFNFSGTKKFDASTGFRSKSMLVIPMKNSDDEVIGVCQLINRQQDGTIVAFNKDDEFAISALASQAAVAITNTKLINSLEALLDSFIKSIAAAIDAKSPYTGGHVKKVAILTQMIADAINADTEGKFTDIAYDSEKLRELQVAALMHDVGKIATPTHIMDKATKLETIGDRIEFIQDRFELYKAQQKILFLEKAEGKKAKKVAKLQEAFDALSTQVDKDMEFLKLINIGGEFMSDDKIERLKQIASRKVEIRGQMQNLLSDDEVYNLSIRKGTLTDEEMQIMRDHAKISNDMLSQLPFPKKLARVPAIASGHHEKLNGKGYPNGIGGDDLSLEARILAVADIFEALSASDRPYKEAKKMSEIQKIIGFMIKDGELDPDLVELFYEKGLHVSYARKYLKPEQLDNGDVL